VAGRLLETIRLHNGLVLEFWDESRSTAGDRWYVGVRAVVPVPLSGPVPAGPLEKIVYRIRREVGDIIHYRFLEEKHFVPADKVAGQQRELIRIFLDNSLQYLSHPGFPGNFIRRKALEIQEKSGWPEEHVRKVLDDLKWSNCSVS
jgi:hypothetical protein